MKTAVHTPTAIEICSQKIIDLEVMALHPRTRDHEVLAIHAEAARLRRRIRFLRWLETRERDRA